jgi:murein L,D-transpeptidase YafK
VLRRPWSRGPAPALFVVIILASCVQKPPPGPLPPPVVQLPAKATSVLVLKAAHKLYLMRGETVLYSFPIALGHHPRGTKLRQGDQRTPEGRYVLDWRNPHSQFYRSIHISYPNEQDLARARENGFTPGGEIMIHGLPSGMAAIGARHAATDWTDGCIAVTDEEMDLIWRTVDDNTPIEIRP